MQRKADEITYLLVFEDRPIGGEKQEERKGNLSANKGEG